MQRKYIITKMFSSAIRPLQRFLPKYEMATKLKRLIFPRRSHTDLRKYTNTKCTLSSHKDVGVHATSSAEIAMNGGDGYYSYAHNSTFQRAYTEAAREILKQDIISKLDVKKTTSFRITDLGCSAGPNTYLAVDTIVEAIEQKIKSQAPNSRIPEIEVLFNDTISNDFNTLLRCLPLDRRYFAAAVPGTFYGRLFPKASIHIAFSAWTLCWLSKVPKEVTDKNSPAWNKGSIHYNNGARNEVFQAYKAQFAIDMELFLRTRAEEIVGGGLMALLVPTDPYPLSNDFSTLSSEFELLGSCLVDMAKQGIVSEEKVDSFNLPLYYSRPTELKELIVQNGSFSIERMEILDMDTKTDFTMLDAKMRSSILRAAFEMLMGQHFGYEIVDEIFDRYAKKTSANQPKDYKTLVLFIILKRNAY